MFARDRVLTAWLLGLAALTQSCSACLTGEQLRTLEQGMRAQNIAESEQTMRAAAQRAGATLLSVSPEQLYEPELLPTDDDHVYRLINAQGDERLVIVIPSSAWRYARLAQSGDTFFVLEPKPTQRQTDRVQACMCDASEHPVTEIWNVFLVEPRASATVKRLSVPMIERVLDVRCKGYGA
jgi:hypothetical protein